MENDLEEKLGAILSNPELMQQIQSMAQSLGQPPSASPSEQKKLPFDPSILQKLGTLAGQADIDTDQPRPLLAAFPLSQSKPGQKAGKTPCGRQKWPGLLQHFSWKRRSANAFREVNNMYNRYIPQSDGSFQRRRIPEPISHAMPAPCPSEMPAAPPTCPPPKPSRPSPPPRQTTAPAAGKK